MSGLKNIVLLGALFSLSGSCSGGSSGSVPQAPQKSDTGAPDTVATDTVSDDVIQDTVDVPDDVTTPEVSDIFTPPDVPDTLAPEIAAPDTATVDALEDTTPPPDPACITDDDCDDANLCSTDKCLGGGKCFHLGIENCCNTPANCKGQIKPCEAWQCNANQCEVDNGDCASITATVSTVSGFNLQGYQDGPIETAMFGRPSGMTIDSQGVVYVTDLMGHTIRSIANGQVTTVAGGSNTQTGKWSLSSEPWLYGGNLDGPVATALFNMPSDVLVDDATGTIYVLDMLNQRLKQIQDGMVTTIAGGSGAEFADGPATTATFSFPTCLVFAPDGGIYIADATNHRIRHLSADKNTVTTVAGSGVKGFLDGPAEEARFNEPYSIVVDGTGALIITDYNNQRIRKLADGVVSTFAGSGIDFCPAGTKEDKGCTTDGALLTASFASPTGMFLHSNGTIYVVEQVGHTVRSIANGLVETLAGTGEAGNLDGPGATAQFNFPIDIVERLDGSLWITDEQNQSIRQILFE